MTATAESVEQRQDEASGDAGRRVQYLPLVMGVLLALPTLLSYYPPMTDLPMHEGVVGIMRHYGNPEWFPVNIYRLNLGHPNQLFHFASWLLSLVVGSRWAIKIVVATAQFAIFHAGVRFASYRGRSPWAAVLLAPLALGYTYYWGLVANLVGFSALLYALPTIDRFTEAPTTKRALGVFGLLVYLFFAHESCFAIGVGVLGLFTALRPLDVWKTTLRLVPPFIAGVSAIAHHVWEQVIMPASIDIVPPMWLPVRDKAMGIPNVLFGSHALEAVLPLFGLFMIGVITLAVSRIRHDPTTPLAEAAAEFRFLPKPRAFLHRYRFEIVAFVYLAFYFALPTTWHGITLLNERFLGPAAAVFVICASPLGETPRIAKFASTVLVPGVLLISWPQFVDSSRVHRDLDTMLAQLPKGRSVALVALDRTGVWNFRVYNAGISPARSVTEIGGRSSSSLTISPISPILIAEPYRRTESERRLLNGSRNLLPEQDLESWEYVLINSRELWGRMAAARVLARAGATQVAAEGDWILMHSTRLKYAMEQVPPEPDYNEQTILDIVKTMRPGKDGTPRFPEELKATE